MLKISTGLLLALSVAASEASAHSTSPATQNANHIFNAVHSSMRQWGSSLIHNGMTVFVATVPEGTQLYHGTSQSERVNDTQWLAFEPEHALVFARSRTGGPPGSDRNHGQEDYRPNPPKQGLKARHPHEPHDDRPLTHTMGQRERARVCYQQTQLEDKQSEPKQDAAGYLHSYRAKHNLRLLYLDGQSAAKSTKGTLDTSDVVLLHDNPPPADGGHRQPPHDKPGSGDENRRRSHIFKEPAKDKRPKTGGPMSEGFRADHLCAMAEKEWNGKIDGFLRMELGFEIILCSFKHGLDLERITQAKSSGSEGGPPALGDGSINYYQAVASRFDSIGGDRVSVDFDNFVTLYAFDDAMQFDNEGLPRANNNTKVLKPVLEAITDMAVSKHTTTPFDWQAIADMVVARYSDRIETLAYGAFAREQDLKDEIERAVRPFVDYDSRNTSAEVQRCATQYFPTLPPADTVAASAILDVTTYLCTALFDSADQHYSDALSTVRSLKRWLGWTTFKRCRGCAPNEVCFIPIWPMGGEEDFENPKCISNMSETSRGYWEHMGGPPPYKDDRR